MSYATLEMFLTGLIAVLIAAAILGSISYILNAVGIYRICRELGCTHYAYFGWIPFANTWIIAFLAAECNPTMMDKYSSKSIAWAYLGCTVALGWVLGTFGLGVITWPLLFFIDIFFRTQIIGRYYNSSVKWLFAFFSPIGMFLAGVRANEVSRNSGID